MVSVLVRCLHSKTANPIDSLNDTMRQFLRDFLERFAKASVFANADNFGDTLRLLEAQRQAELENRRSRALRAAASRLAHRPGAVPGRDGAARRRSRIHLLAAS